ncbi:ArsR family transcriptional regulator [Corynebacterium casei]
MMFARGFVIQKLFFWGVPRRKEVMTELGLSEATVKRHLRALKKEGLLPS